MPCCAKRDCSVLGLSIQQTTKAIGRSAGTTTTLRNRFIKDLTLSAPAKDQTLVLCLNCGGHRKVQAIPLAV